MLTSLKISFDGVFIDFAKLDLSGIKPPKLILLSSGASVIAAS